MQRSFVYYGQIRGQGRPRTRVMKTGKGYAAIVYKDEKDREYEYMIACAYQVKHQSVEPISGAFGIQIKAIVEPPKSATQKRRSQMLLGYVKPTVKPDLDNVCKAVLDSLNGVAFTDDRNCTNITATKTYGEEERLEITLTYEVNEDGKSTLETDAGSSA